VTFAQTRHYNIKNCCRPTSLHNIIYVCVRVCVGMKLSHDNNILIHRDSGMNIIIFFFYFVKTLAVQEIRTKSRRQKYT